MSDDRYNHYSEEFKITEQQMLAQGTKLSQTIITLSGGALALSVTFLEKIAAEPAPYTLPFLGGSWLLLCLSLLSILLAIASSHQAMDFHLDYLIDCLNDPEKEHERPENPHNSRTFVMKRISLWACVLGVIFLATFAFINAVLKA
ncbi:MAG: hypothetical protein Q7Q73_07360 [Verrucomicrobiota bacterium JB024]|nr:hypothetical protein [Verrucomicrobiota bacterium JB024]